MMKRFAAFLFLCNVWVLSVGAQAQEKAGKLVVDEAGLNVYAKMDWSAAMLTIDVTKQLDPTVAALPQAKGDAETEIESRLGEFVTAALSTVVVDSSHTYGDLLGNDPALFSRTSALAEEAQQSEISLSDDLTHLFARYSLPLFGLQGAASPFYPSRSEPIRRRLGWVPTRPFTGLLIYAKGMLPAVGTNGAAQARPALFPRIFDESMTLVMEKGMCSPEALAKWGMVGYAMSLDDQVVVVRAGELPLRLVARGVFGDNSTDLVIPREGALQLLTLPENRKLLEDGRIVIVYDSLD
jgi:hypothetical protein